MFFYSACGNREHQGNLQNKLAGSLFNWVSRYILFLAKLNRRGRSFLEGARRTGAALLLDPLTNKHCRAWIFMINWTIDSGPAKSTESCCQLGKGLKNYLELSKENVLGNVMLSHWPWFTWKFFMIWSHEILKLTFQKPASCPRNTCTEIFLYLKNRDSDKSLVNCLIHLFRR